MTSVDGFNVKPARDLTEAEARERLAKEHEQYAALLDRAVDQKWRAQAPKHRARAAALRKGAPK